jgi:hypothetical protein
LRSESGGDQQRIVLPERDVEGSRQPVDHVPARRRTLELEKAQVTLRNVGLHCQFELRKASMLAPPSQLPGE